MPSKTYETDLHQELRDTEFASGYLSQCFELGMDEFLLGLKDVVEANGGVAQLAEATALNRESLYRLLSERGNPRLSSLALILDALGIKLAFAPGSSGTPEAA